MGNLERGITGQEVAKALNAILKPHLEIELEDVASPGILATSAGYCFIEFDRTSWPPCPSRSSRAPS